MTARDTRRKPRYLRRVQKNRLPPCPFHTQTFKPDSTGQPIRSTADPSSRSTVTARDTRRKPRYLRRVQKNRLAPCPFNAQTFKPDSTGQPVCSTADPSSLTANL